MNETARDNRLVLPQWLPFRQAALQREANTFVDPRRPTEYSASSAAFADALAEFEKAPSPFVACELMGIAEVLGNRSIARRIAEYVLTQSFVGNVAHAQARSILGEIVVPYEDDKERIRLAKRRVRDFPRDAIAWVEQARLYTILGQHGKARRAILAALHLAPADRYVVRAAIRYFAHSGEWDMALAYAKKAVSLTTDPLIVGPFLSVCTHLNTFPRQMKPTVERALRSRNVFVNSEALEAIGTMEIMSGALKKSRRFFKRAWIDPAKAVVSHSQWVIREHLPTLAEEKQIDYSQNQQALSWLRYSILDFDGALARTLEWGLEEPYSREPFILGSNAACLMDDFSGAEMALKLGLLANPKDETLLNNLAFAQLRAGKVDEAERTFAPLFHILTKPDQVAPVATYGLLLMSKGQLTEGTNYYLEAMKRAKDTGDDRLMIRAALNLLISSVDIMQSVDPEIFKQLTNSLQGCDDAGCLGTAEALGRRLRGESVLVTDQLRPLIHAFLDRIVVEKKKLMESDLASLLPAKGNAVDTVSPI